MPRPKKGEKRSDFVSRFMGSKHAKKYPQKQRAAIAYSMWRERKKK